MAKDIKKEIVEGVLRSDTLAHQIQETKTKHPKQLQFFTETQLRESSKRSLKYDGLRAAEATLGKYEALSRTLAKAIRDKQYGLKWALVASKLMEAEAACEVARWEKIEEISPGNEVGGYTEEDVSSKTIRSYKKCVREAEKTKRRDQRSIYEDETSNKKARRTIAGSSYMQELQTIIRDSIHSGIDSTMERLKGYCKANTAPVAI